MAMSKPVQPVCTKCRISAEELVNFSDYDGDFLCVECQLEEEHDTFEEDCKCQARQNTLEGSVMR